jgi:hypothetical protein
MCQLPLPPPRKARYFKVSHAKPLFSDDKRPAQTLPRLPFWARTHLKYSVILRAKPSLVCQTTCRTGRPDSFAETIHVLFPLLKGNGPSEKDCLLTCRKLVGAGPTATFAQLSNSVACSFLSSAVLSHLIFMQRGQKKTSEKLCLSVFTCRGGRPLGVGLLPQCDVLRERVESNGHRSLGRVIDVGGLRAKVLQKAIHTMGIMTNN